MLEAPGVVLQIRPERGFSVSGLLQERVQRVVATLTEKWRLPAPPEVLVDVISAPKEHIGLGVGTQLTLALAAGLGESLGFPWRDPLRLAQLTSRGRRSAVGTHGFVQGGLIVDGGHRHGEPLGELIHRSNFPHDWRFVLFIPRTRVGHAGRDEERAFARLPSVGREVTERLEAIATTELVPASISGDFARFSNALYLYGSLAGKCFVAVQGSAFCSPETAALIDWLRAQGVAGVGQSSWGPTVFALSADQISAEQLAQEFATHPDADEYEVHITPAANQGANVKARTLDSPTGDGERWA
jgi:beta-RFAP synthase